ncbi:MAG: hypothetical protein KTR25_06345 [Myxococcales bacterium]|nr:hypothetical protein [Myxococcales bacterium]
MDAIDAVLPLTKRDFPRAEILLRSLERFFDGLKTVRILVPRKHQAEAESLCFPTRFAVEILPEQQVAPELDDFPRVRGWYKQQLLKLAVYEHVQSPFYLTLDADVVATRKVSPRDLVVEGRARSYVIASDEHSDWYRGTQRLLGTPLVRTGLLHAVTPAVLAREGVAALAVEMQRRIEARHWSQGWSGIKQQWARFRGHRSWRAYLLAGLPWTEYALYYSFLELEGIYERYHREESVCIYDIERSLWKEDAARFDDSWDPSPLFVGEGPPFFAVLQSNTRIPAANIAKCLAPYL